MEPEDVSDYSKQTYWDARYTKEPEYDWFETAYAGCLEKAWSTIFSVYQAQCGSAGREEDPRPFVVVHLGCGNSKLCYDIARRWEESVAGANGSTVPRARRLHQIAVDYSPVVIQNMKHRYGDELISPCTTVEWVVDDIRHLVSIASGSADVIIDKATMDALQADKENDTMDEDIDAMLKQVSRVLIAGESQGAFVQMTWEIPYYRFHFTKRPEYAWGSSLDGTQQSFIGESDLYRCYVYPVGGFQGVRS